MKLNTDCDQSEKKNLATCPAQPHVIAAFFQLQKLQQLLHSLEHKHVQKVNTQCHGHGSALC